jgi:DNA invertase Pin-like site-specific DNA recombinase
MNEYKNDLRGLSAAELRSRRDQLAAIVYVRQSTLVQVREHTESTLRQYDLAGQAARLGWPAAGIEVIDADLGLSGRTATRRDGFKQLVARVCPGEAGAVFGLEVSRLARSNADLARLLELARLTGTLVIDNDGVYDLSDINDRLLLGLKSQMSEAELHWLTSRMNEAKRAAARRGELRVPLPVGLVYDDDGMVVIDPDEEVAAAIGRRRSRQVVNPDGSVRSSVTLLPRDQWEVLIRDHHPGYITWEDYLANEAKLAVNRTNAGARPPREGTALCQGIVFCGACGRSMQVRYQDRLPRYECGHSRADHVATPLCGSVRADTVDAVAADALLAATAPEQVTLALPAAEQVTARRQRSVRAAELAAERARYDAGRAERAFLACEPENRLVARALEARWETRLADLADAEAALAAQRSAQPELPAPDALAATVADLPALWADPAASDKDRKRLLRAARRRHHHPGRPGPDPDPGRAALEIRGQPADPGHPAQERLPAAIHRPGRDRAGPPDRPRPGQQRPGRRAQPGRAPHRHRAALRRGRRRQPAQLPPHPLPRPARGRRADPASGRRADRRVRRHRALLDHQRLPHRPPRPGRPLVHPLPARGRAGLP